MIIDSSAVVAVVLGEPGWERYEQAIVQARRPRMASFSVFEAGCVLLRRKGRRAVDAMLAFLAETGVAIEPLDPAGAIDAYEMFGKGMSPVGLNLGDYAVYALARTHGEPVLSTSDEFVRAGLKSAI